MALRIKGKGSLFQDVPVTGPLARRSNESSAANEDSFSSNVYRASREWRYRLGSQERSWRAPRE